VNSTRPFFVVIESFFLTFEDRYKIENIFLFFGR